MDNNAPNDASHAKSQHDTARYKCIEKTGNKSKDMVKADALDKDFKMPFILTPADAAFILMACSFVISGSVAIYVTIAHFFKHNTCLKVFFPAIALNLTSCSRGISFLISQIGNDYLLLNGRKSEQIPCY